MDTLYSDFLKILKSALQNTTEQLSETYSFEQCLDIAKRHQIKAMFYYGLMNCGVSQTEAKLPALFEHVCREMAVNETQKYEYSLLTAAFDEQGIDYLPLKGIELKEIYPSPEMRPMGDIDILIKVPQYREIKPIMEKLGFEEGVESNHEFVWRKPGCMIELHKLLIPSYNKDYFAYYGDGWRLAKKQSGTRYCLSDEDKFIYLFTHFAKHYRDSGIGLRHIIDVWVYLKNYPDLDLDYVLTELKKLQLDEFYKNIVDTLEFWFGDGKSTDITEFITEFIFNNGVYGTKHTHILSTALKDKKEKKSISAIKRKKVLNAIFVPYSDMCKLYPVLEKWPVFFPFYWVPHFFIRVFQKGRLKNYANDYSLLKEESVSGYEKELHFVGLDYNFEE